MRVAFDNSPLETNHNVRGIGSYTQNLVNALKEVQNLELEFFKNGEFIPRADLVHYPYFDLFFKSLPSSRNYKRIVTIHDVIPLVFPDKFPAGPRGFINLFFQKRALKNVDFVICDSQTSLADIADKLSYPKEKIVPIYLAAPKSFKKMEPQKLFQFAKKLKLPKTFAIYVGDVNWNKNLDNLVRSIKVSKIPLLMVGSAITNNNIPETKALNQLIRKLNIESLIIKTGFVSGEELIALYNLASVTLLPSYYEGFGLPLLESMACGTPVVTSDNSSLSEIAGAHALFCDPQNPVDISQKTLKILEMKPKEKSILSQKLISHAAKYSWEKTAAETFKVYQKALR